MVDATTIEAVNAVASCATALFTLALVVVAYTQIRALREENRKWETVKACNLYDTDPVLHACAGHIRSLSRGQDYSFTNMAPAYHQVRTLLNYCDSLAVGVSQGVYIEQIIQDNLRLVIEQLVDKFTTDDFSPELNFEGLAHLIQMRNRWRPQVNTKFSADRTKW
jgi:hypothetical protein